MDKVTEREKFEAWAKDNDYDPSSDGERHFDDRTNIAWAAWQAALIFSTPVEDSNGGIAADDVNELVHALDVLLNGEHSAGRKARLGELVEQVAAIKRSPPVAWYRASPEESDWYWESEIKAGDCCPKSDIPRLVALYAHLPPTETKWDDKDTPPNIQEAAEDLFRYLDSYRDAQLDKKTVNFRKLLGKLSS